MNTEFIQLRGVTKRFRKNLVLDNISLSIPEQQITGIIGASGEGKSTILKLIIAFYKPDKGDVFYLKRSVLKDIKYVRKLFGFSTEDGSFYENLTVKENIFHFGSLYKMKRSEITQRYNEIIPFVGLSHAQKTLAKNLSVGMKKRLDIACSLIHNPEVLILDEPTADLDPLLRDQILRLIRKIRDQGTTIILTSQLLEEMDRVCDKVVILCNKKIVEEGSPASIRSKYKTASLNGVFAKLFEGRFKEVEEKETARNLDKGKEREENPRKVQKEDLEVKNKKSLNISRFIDKFEKGKHLKKPDAKNETSNSKSGDGLVNFFQKFTSSGQEKKNEELSKTTDLKPIDPKEEKENEKPS